MGLVIAGLYPDHRHIPTLRNYSDWVSEHLHGYYGTHDLHFIPGSCYRRRAYFFGETGPVRVTSQEWALEIKRRPVFAEVESPLIRKVRE